MFRIIWGPLSGCLTGACPVKPFLPLFNRGAKKNPNPQKHQSHLPPNTCPNDPHKKSV